MRSRFAGPNLLCGSTLGLIEVIATLSRKRKASELSPQEFKEKCLELEQDWQTFVQIQVDFKVVDRAKDVADRFALRGADAVHFASLLLLAEDAARLGREVVLLTSDRELLQTAMSVGIQAMDPGSHPPHPVP